MLRRFNVLRSPAPPRTVDYARFVERVLARAEPGYLRFPCVTPQWDNTPRRPHAAFLFTNSTPGLFGAWVSEVTRRLQAFPSEHRLLFVNAWNEWGEGCHLEPCQRWGTGYLEAFAEAVCKGVTP